MFITTSPPGARRVPWLKDVLFAAMAVCSLVSAWRATRTDGQALPCGPSVLFIRISRFSDFDLMVPVVRAAHPYALGLQYPPGAVVLFRALSDAPDTLARWIGLQYVHERVAASTNAGDIAACPTVVLDGSHAALVLIGGIGLALIAVRFLFRHEHLALRCVTALAIVASTVFAVGAIDIYNQVLAVVGNTALVALIVQMAIGRRLPSMVFAPLLGTSYAIVFSIDRGNIDVVLFLMLVVAIALIDVRRPRLTAMHLSAGLVALAVVIKVYPAFLLGIYLRRRASRPALITAIVAGLALYLAGALAIGEGPLGPINGMRGNLTGGGGDPGWGLIFSRSLLAFLQFASFERTGNPAITAYPALVAAWPFISLGAVVAAFAVLARARSPFWVRLGLAISIVLVFNSGGGVYRLFLVLIAAAVAVAALDPPRRGGRHPLQYLAIAIAGIAISPLYMNRLPGGPIGFVPDDTLYGSGALLVLLALYGAIAMTPSSWGVRR